MNESTSRGGHRTSKQRVLENGTSPSKQSKYLSNGEVMKGEHISHGVPSHQWDSRIASIEQNHIDLQKDVRGIAQNQAAHEQALSGIESALKNVVSNQTTILTPKWGVMATMFGAVMLVVGLVLFEPLNRVVEHHRLHVEDGHPKSVVAMIGEREANIESRLDQNQALLVSVETHVDALTERQARIDERFTSIERDVYANDLIKRQ